MTHDEDAISNDDVEDDKEPRQISSSSKMKWVRCLALLVVVLAYLFAGALVFRALERPPALKAAQDFDAVLLRLASENDCVDETDVAELMNIVNRAIGEGGYDGSLPYAAQVSTGTVNSTLLSRMWSITNAFVFVSTVVTTVGFGYTAPRTRIGQFVCVIYAVIGILLTGGIILSIGEIIHVLSHRKLAKCTKKLKACIVCRPRLWSTAAVLFNTLLVFLLLLIPGSLIYSCTQQWSFQDSLYFSVIAMTTIGFGDQQTTYPSIPLWQEFALKIVYFTYFFVCLGVLSTMFGKFSRAQHRAAYVMSFRLSRYHRQQRLHNAEVELAETRGSSHASDNQERS